MILRIILKNLLKLLVILRLLKLIRLKLRLLMLQLLEINILEKVVDLLLLLLSFFLCSKRSMMPVLLPSRN